MKKIVSFFVSMLIIMFMCSVSTFAATNKGVVELPADDGTGYPLRGVTTDDYMGNDEITEVIVPENIIRLGDELFFDCSNLKKINLHNKIQVIGRGCFEGTAIYDNESNWVDGVLYIDDCLIKANPEKISKSYKVKEGTRLIAEEAFFGCSNLEEILLPDSVEYIGENAFRETAFYNNKSNWSEDGGLYIGHALIDFDSEYNAKFSVPENIKVIADGTFWNSKITELVISDNVKYIGYNTFMNCCELKSIKIGKSVTTIGRRAFKYCPLLEEIVISEENKNFVAIDDVLYNKELTAVIKCAEQKKGKVVLPETIRNINAFAFLNCTEISEVVIPEGCVFIGREAFIECNSINKFDLPSSLEYVDVMAFSGCSKLKEISIPDNVTHLADFAFSYCSSLKKVHIGDSVSVLSQYLFLGCLSLKEVTLGDGVRAIHEDAFEDCNYIEDANNYKNGLLIISDKYLIKVAQYVEKCEIPAEIEVVAYNAFEYPLKSGRLKEVYVPSSIKYLDSSTFSGLSKIPVYYDGYIDEITGDYYFYGHQKNLYTRDLNVHMGVAIGSFVIVMVTVIVAIVMNKKKRDTKLEGADEYDGN